MRKLLLVAASALALLASPVAATVTTTASSVSYTANGATTVFPYAFVIPFQANGVTPAVTVQTITNGVIATVPTNQYTISGVGNANGGSVTFNSAPATGTTVAILRSLAYTQPDVYSNQSFYPATIGTSLDKLDMQIQQLNTLITQQAVLSFNGRGGNIILGTSDIVGALGYSPVSSVNGETGPNVVLNSTDIIGALGYTPLSAANNLSDLTSVSAAWSSLGLGTAAGANTGTSGTAVPFLSGANTWSGRQTFPAATTSAASLNVPAGVAPTTPSIGDVWQDGTTAFMRIGSTNVPLGTVTATTVTSWKAQGDVSAQTANVVMTGTSVTNALGYTPANKAGDTFSGAVTFNATTTIGSGQSLNLTGTGAQNRGIGFNNGASQRWFFYTSSGETGSGNVGGDMLWCRYGDNGIQIDCPIGWNRATGIATLSNGLSVNSGPVTLPTGSVANSALDTASTVSGSCGSATAACTITSNAQGRVTAMGSATIIPSMTGTNTAGLLSNSGGVVAWSQRASAYVTNCGAGGCTVSGSKNVSTVSRSSAGKYTVTFANAMPNTTYTLVCTAADNSMCGEDDGFPRTGSQVAFTVRSQNGTLIDPTRVNVLVLEN